MSRRPAADVSISVQIEGIPFKIATSTLTQMPDAVAYIRHELHLGVSAPVAAEYARLAARAFRLGYAANPARITSRPERTAVNAYWTWAEVAYHERVRPVLQALATYDVRLSLPWLRVGSIVPPQPGKRVPQMVRMAQVVLNEETHEARMVPAEIVWRETAAWTLHLPQKPCPAHTDPCEACVVVELDEAKLEVIAKAFEGAWGHRDISKVPPECLLFGQPPREDGPATRAAVTSGNIVALLPPGALTDVIRQLKGYTTELEDGFRSRLSEGEVDVVVISREAAGKRFSSLLSAVRTAWAGDDEAARVAGLEPEAAVATS